VKRKNLRWWAAFHKFFFLSYLNSLHSTSNFTKKVILLSPSDQCAQKEKACMFEWCWLCLLCSLCCNLTLNPNQTNKLKWANQTRQLKSDNQTNLLNWAKHPANTRLTELEKANSNWANQSVLVSWKLPSIGPTSKIFLTSTNFSINLQSQGQLKMWQHQASCNY